MEFAGGRLDGFHVELERQLGSGELCHAFLDQHLAARKGVVDKNGALHTRPHVRRIVPSDVDEQ